MNSSGVSGIHHVTCVSGSPHENLAFYANVLGLRLVKTTVHFDNVDVYHLYYGDDVGTPGSILTFFPYPSASRGLHGTGAATNTTFAVPEGAQNFWLDRLSGRLVGGWEVLHGDPALRFVDDEGQELRLVAAASVEASGASTGVVPYEHAVRYIKGIDLVVHAAEPTQTLLTDLFGLNVAGGEDDRIRLTFPSDPLGYFVDLVLRPDAPAARQVPLEGLLPEAGTVNHVAFGPVSEHEQIRLRDALLERGYDVTPVKDRRYFKSIYFLDPSGIRLEIATAEPGFAIDEDLDRLGEELKLPPSLEHRRAEYEAALPPLDRRVLVSNVDR